jgi:hypothetical protein
MDVILLKVKYGFRCGQHAKAVEQLGIPSEYWLQ